MRMRVFIYIPRLTPSNPNNPQCVYLFIYTWTDNANTPTNHNHTKKPQQTVAEMAKKFSDESAFSTLIAETQGQGGEAAAAGVVERKEVKTLDDVQAAFAAATSARKQLVRSWWLLFGWVCLFVV